MLTVGMVVSLLSLAIGGFLGWSQATQFDWYPYKPLWMLSNEAMSTVPRSRINKPQREIRRRLEDDTLADRQINRLIEKALSIQADQTTTWDSFWGDVIETAWDKKKLPDDQLQRYLKTAAFTGQNLAIRSRIRQGERVPIRRGFGQGTRAGRSGRFYLFRDYRLLRIGDIELDKGSSGTGAGPLGSGGSWSTRLRKIDVPLGKYEVSIECRFRAAPADSIDHAEFVDLSNTDRETMIETHKLLDWIDTARRPVEVVATGDPVIELVDDPALKEVIREAITVRRVRLIQRRRLRAVCRIDFDTLPIPVGFQVLWRVGEQEWPVQRITALETEGSVERHGPIMGVDGFPIDATRVDIILRSSAQSAEQRAGLDRIWQGEIVIPNLPLDIEQRD